MRSRTVNYTFPETRKTSYGIKHISNPSSRMLRKQLADKVIAAMMKNTSSLTAAHLRRQITLSLGRFFISQFLKDTARRNINNFIYTSMCTNLNEYVRFLEAATLHSMHVLCIRNSSAVHLYRHFIGTTLQKFEQHRVLTKIAINR